jgi:hypothetical protein
MSREGQWEASFPQEI